MDSLTKGHAPRTGGMRRARWFQCAPQGRSEPLAMGHDKITESVTIGPDGEAALARRRNSPAHGHVDTGVPATWMRD
jgi:hypothetical protein